MKALADACIRFSTGLSASTEQALRVCTCLHPTITWVPSNHHKANRYTRSPVKNRDAGPIAGVAFNGGGGSRQLGPDDNDPVSATRIPKHPTTPFLFHHKTHQPQFFFSSPTTNVAHYRYYAFKFSIFSSTFSPFFASNRMSELATIRERRLLLCVQGRGRVCVLRKLSTRFPLTMLRSAADAGT